MLRVTRGLSTISVRAARSVLEVQGDFTRLCQLGGLWTFVAWQFLDVVPPEFPSEGNLKRKVKTPFRGITNSKYRWVWRANFNQQRYVVMLG